MRSFQASAGSRGVVAFALIALALGALVARIGLAIAFIVPVALGVLALVVLVRSVEKWSNGETNRRIMAWTIASFVGHLVFGLLVTNSQTAKAYLGGDADTYHGYAVTILQYGEAALGPAGLPSGKEGFYYVLVGLYWLFGPHHVAGLVFNATLAAALVPLMSDTTRRAFGPAAARYVPPLVVLLPTWFLFTSQLLKEASILFLIAVAMNCATRVLERVSFTSLAIMAGSLAVLFTFRGYVALVIAATSVIAVMFGSRQLLSGLSAGVSTLSLLAAVILSLGLGYSGFQSALNATSLEDANRFRQGLVDTNSGFGADVDISTPQRALSYLPVALTTISVGPFPWQLRGARQLPALADVLVWWWLLPSLWRGTRAAIPLIKRRVLIYVLPAMVVAVLLALSVSNYGTVVRERMQVIIFLVPLVAFGLSLRPGAQVPLEDLETEPALQR